MGEAVGKFEDARRTMESAGLQQLDVAFRDAIRSAESRIGGAVAEFAPEVLRAVSPLSFVEASAGSAADASHFRFVLAQRVPADC